MIHPISIHDFLQDNTISLVDVRTPAEFAHGHIPGAVNLPIFSNDERVQVGTTYKQAGREQAILLGFDLTGTKWSGFIREALVIAPSKRIAVHCWRGGMRSGAMAWALDLFGFEVYVIQGGYKAYRKWVLRQFEKTQQLFVIGGMTGSGKTKMLHDLHSISEQVIDLEKLARHQGSSYGTLNRLIQPTQEQFENDFAQQLMTMDLQRPIWVEDESISIGKCFIPRSFWNKMQEAVLFDLKVPIECRVQSLLGEYGSLDRDFLVASTERLRKRLGHERTKNAITAIMEDRMQDFIEFVLFYYDKCYRASLLKRAPALIVPVTVATTASIIDARHILSLAQTLPIKDEIL